MAVTNGEKIDKVEGEARRTEESAVWLKLTRLLSLSVTRRCFLPLVLVALES